MLLAIILSHNRYKYVQFLYPALLLYNASPCSWRSTGEWMSL